MGKKILLADDSLTIQKVVELTLAGTDYELTCVSNGQKALDALAASRPDLIFADVVMPEKNGYEVCEAVKGDPATAKIPVILLSGTFEPFDRERANRIGCDLVVSKPFDAQQLLGRIETLLGRAPSPPPSFPREEEGPFEMESFDGALPASVPPGSTDAEDPFGRGDEAPPRERALLTAGGAQVPLPAEREEPGAEDALWLETAAAPSETGAEPSETAATSSETGAEPSEVAAPSSEIAATPSETAAGEPAEPERHPVEETPVTALAPTEPSPGEILIEEISAEEAAVLFDVPYEPEPPSPVAAPPAVAELTEEQIERIAARIVEKLSDRVVREIAWEVVPDVAEMAVRRRIKELESGVE